MLKKMVYIVLLISMLFALVACGGGGLEDTANDAATVQQNTSSMIDDSVDAYTQSQIAMCKRGIGEREYCLDTYGVYKGE